jgi:hypothetical protein
VTTTMVHDQVFLNGEETEDTFDWEAQDAQGNVWYFGEDSKELENGVVVSTQGSWQAGVDGARPGIIMLAHPRTGELYIQEDAPDVAEDRAKVLSTKAKVEVPFGGFTGCIPRSGLCWSTGIASTSSTAQESGWLRRCTPPEGTLPISWSLSLTSELKGTTMGGARRRARRGPLSWWSRTI